MAVFAETPTRSAALSAFTAWAQAHITGDEKGEAQIFIDHLFRAFGHPGSLEVGGSGNFLYIAYRELKRLEARIYEKLETYSSKAERGQMRLSYLSAQNFHGLDINPFAVGRFTAYPDSGL